MNFGFLVTGLEHKRPKHTTIRLAREAANRGHFVWFFAPGDFSLRPDDELHLRVRRAPEKRFKNNTSYLKELMENPVETVLPVRDLDLILLRDNPAKHRPESGWAKPTGAAFGRIAVSQGVVVVNDPSGLAGAANKLYFQSFPRAVRPLTLISRNLDEIREFAESLDTDLILKPLQGSGGDGVFMVKKQADYNLNQLFDALAKDGYIIAQEYLPAARQGDVRILMLNGSPLRSKGKYAVIGRVQQGSDIRSNIHAGGQEAAVELTDSMLELCEMVRPKLVQDGMFLVGLDIVGDKLMEINVFCPDGLCGIERLSGVNFATVVIDALERKVRHAQHYGRVFDNRTMATL